MSDESKLPQGARKVGGEARRWIKWESVGETITGRLIKLEASRKFTKPGQGENHVLHVRLKPTEQHPDGERVIASAPLLLRQTIEDEKLLGKRVAIVFVSEQKTKKGRLKHFEVGIFDDDAGSDDGDVEDDDLPF